MHHRAGTVAAVVVGLLAGWIAAAVLASWGEDGTGGSTAFAAGVGLVVGLVAFGLVLAAAARLGDRNLLGPARRPAGGVGEESASPDRREDTTTGSSDA